MARADVRKPPPRPVTVAVALLVGALVVSLVLTALDDPVALIGQLDAVLFVIVVTVGLWLGVAWGWGAGVVLGVLYVIGGVLTVAGVDRFADGGPIRAVALLGAGAVLLAVLALPGVRAHYGITPRRRP